MLGDDPPYLSVGTEVSAKYKGAFCEAKIRKVVRSVKCRVTFKQGLGTATVADDQIKGVLRVGASVEAKHSDKKDYVEATITKIQDCSQYTVVFDDGDITTLRRTALCLKSGRHFAESETLDQLPLTHPEHFGNPVIGGRRGRRSRQAQDDSSEDEESPPRGINDSASGNGNKEGMETEPEIGRVVCVELGDKKKKDNWFPGLVVAPTAQDTVRIRVRDDYLVRSFKDARYYTVPKKEATEFTKELVNKIENSALKVAVEKALLFLEKNELPPHWDRDLLFGNIASSGNSDSDGELDSDSSDDEPREEKDHFVAQLYKFMDDRGTPINNCPMIGNEDIDLYRLFRAVYKLGGYNRVTNQNQWKSVTRRLSFSMQSNSSTYNLVKQAYKKFLHSFEDFYRKLGCTMVNHPRGSIRKQRPGRSLIRDKDRNTPVPLTAGRDSRTEKEEDDRDSKEDGKKKPADDEKKEKRETKKEASNKEEDLPKTTKKKQQQQQQQQQQSQQLEDCEESASGQESDVNVEAEEESSASSSEKSQKRSSSVMKNRSKYKVKEKDEVKKKTDKRSNKNESKINQDRKEDKSLGKDSKEEDSAKTRSKSKEDSVTKKLADKFESSEGGNGTQSTGGSATSKDSDKSEKVDKAEKKSVSKQRRMMDDELKKRGRKRKDANDSEKRPAVEDKPDNNAPCYKGPVEVGDRLQVYYGPNHESKVTYEAKVVDVDHTSDPTGVLYLVHYTGWNTRYDEWIKVSRIAQNFTQTQARVKRTKSTPRPQTPSSTKATSGTSSEKALSLSSTSQTSSKNAISSDNKNCASSNTTGLSSVAPAATERGRRRAQSVAPASEKRDNDSKKETNEEKSSIRSATPTSSCSSTRTKSPAVPLGQRSLRGNRNLSAELRRRIRKVFGQTDQSIIASDSEESNSYESDITEPEHTVKSKAKSTTGEEKTRREARKRAENRIKVEVDNSDIEREESKANEEPRRGRRLRRTPGKNYSAQQEVKSEPDSDDEQPKGRDFDLNQIRSELKGFDKAVKMDMMRVEQMQVDELKTADKNNEALVSQSVSSPKAEKKPEIKVETFEPKFEESTEDIYEFKEPEPFEFEVRNKRDFNGEKDKLKKRSFEEDSSKNSPKKKVKLTPALQKEVKQEAESFSSDYKKRSRKNFVAKTKTNEDVTLSPNRQPQTIPTSTACEEAFDKLCDKIAQHIQIKKEFSDNTQSTEDNMAKVSANLLYDDGPTGRVDDSVKDRLAIASDIDNDSTRSCQKEAVVNVRTNANEDPVDNEKNDKIDIKDIKAKSTTASGKDDSTVIMLIKCAVDSKTQGTSDQKPVSKSLVPGTSSIASTTTSSLTGLIPTTTSVETKNYEYISPMLAPSVAATIPIAARLPATSSIEEKLSAAAAVAFGKRDKDFKKDETVDPPKKLPKKNEGSNPYSMEITTIRKIIKKYTAKGDSKKGDDKESEKFDNDESKEKNKKDIVTDSTPKIMPTVESAKKLDRPWMKLDNQGFSLHWESTSGDKNKTLNLNQEFADSTDSSDSEQRLVIDNEDFQEDKPVSSYEKTFLPKIEPEAEKERDKEKEREKKSSAASGIGTKLLRTDRGEEDRENLSSLLCEEEIPGSPTSELEEKEEPESSTTSGNKNSPKSNCMNDSALATLMEMPFASAPTSSEQSKMCESSVTISMALPQSCSIGTVGVSGRMVQQLGQLSQLSQLENQLSQLSQMGGQMSNQLSQLSQAAGHVQAQHEQKVIPAPSMVAVVGPTHGDSNEAAPVMDNTPPTTPDSSISNMSESPREERTGGSSPASEDNSSKPNRDSSEGDYDAKKMDHKQVDGESSSLMAMALSLTKPANKRSYDESSSPKKRKRSRKHSESGNSVSKKTLRQSGRNGRHGLASDSDDTSESSNVYVNTNNVSSYNPITTGTNITNTSTISSSSSATTTTSMTTITTTPANNVVDNCNYSSNSPRPLKYNFYVELDPELDGSQRIAVLQQKLSELRKTYNSVKVELAAIERRRKKLKRREREALKAAKAEMQQACS